MNTEQTLIDHYESLKSQLMRGYPGDQPSGEFVLQAAAQITAAEIVAEAIKSAGPKPWRGGPR